MKQHLTLTVLLNLLGVTLVFTLVFTPAPMRAQIPPLPVDILGPDKKTIGKAEIFPNYVVLLDAAGQRKGAIGVMIVEGRTRLFVVGSGKARRLVGWAEQRRLFNAEGKLVGYYNWTPIWSYVYDASRKKVGQAQCLAYQGVCAAGIAGYLLGLL